MVFIEYKLIKNQNLNNIFNLKENTLIIKIAKRVKFTTKGAKITFFMPNFHIIRIMILN